MSRSPALSKILLVEDDAIIQQVHRLMLEKLGYAVDTAETGHEALVLHKNSAYAAVLLDIRLPDLSGDEVLATIRAREQRTKRRLPIIIATAKEWPGNRKVYLAKGADAYFKKPLVRGSLQTTLAVLI
jgi:CheY-like chemotaxis protein